MKRNNRNRHLDGVASIPLLLLLIQPLDFVFWDMDSGQPTLQVMSCGVLRALGTLQLALGEPSTSEIKDLV